MVSNAQESAEERRTMLSVKDVNIRYGKESALRNVSFDVLENEIFAIIGPANSGKTSFLRALNRMDDMTANMLPSKIVHTNIEVIPRASLEEDFSDGQTNPKWIFRVS